MTLWQRIRRWLDGDSRPVPTPTPKPTPSPSPDATAELLRQHNEARQRQGLRPLRLNGTLQAAATGHANWMARHGSMTHDNDGTFSQRLAAYHGASIGENVAKGQRTVTEVVSDWLSSPGHRRNVLGDYSEVGFGMATGLDGQPYWCADYGLPLVGDTLLSELREQRVSLSGPLER